MNRRKGRGTGSSGSSRLIRVFLVDDQEVARSSFASFINNDPKKRMICVGEHNRNEQKVIEDISRSATDVALIDCVLERYGLPDSLSHATSGFELMKTISKKLPAVRILAMSNFPGVESKARAAGAHGFVVKDGIAEMRDAIVYVAKHRTVGGQAAPARPRVKVFAADRKIQVSARDGSFPTRRLKPASFAVLLYLAQIRRAHGEPAFEQSKREKGLAEYRVRYQEVWQEARQNAGSDLGKDGQLQGSSLAKFVSEANHAVREFGARPLIENIGSKGTANYEIAREFDVELA